EFVRRARHSDVPPLRFTFHVLRDYVLPCLWSARPVWRMEAMTDETLGRLVSSAIEAGEGILRMAPCWVPRSFLMPGGRLKLAPQDIYALGAHRGGIDERWFSSTTPATNEGAPPDEGLRYVVHDGQPFTLRDA